METWIQSILLLGKNKQKVVTDGYPYLCEDCIHSRSVEGFDVQVLLDAFEKDPNLPSFAKSCLNISQAVSVSELSEAHHKEQVPAIELDCMPVTFVAIDTLAEFIFGEERHKLCKDSFTLVHGLRETAQMSSRKLMSSNQIIIFAL